MKQLRKFLDTLYVAGAFIGAAFIVGIGLLITAQVIGREIGTQVKGADDLTAWSVVAAGFMPLAYTYRMNGQIRVTLLIERFSGAVRRTMELLVLATAMFFVGFLTYSAFDMVWDSLRFGDLSNGLIVIPLWIPQLSIGLGTLLFLIAIMDDIAVSLMGGKPSYMEAADTTDMRQH
ncbi:MAG: TRAP transporter small permease [Rhodobacteraceae bacterium]|nr:TRAP transporter small permease [Paracoccaceae bacterium]